MNNKNNLGKKVYDEITRIISESGDDSLTGRIARTRGYIDGAEYNFIQYPEYLEIYGKPVINFKGSIPRKPRHTIINKAGVVKEDDLPEDFLDRLKRFQYYQ
ncbi:hypothetical protein EXS72_01160 [Candidatus Pacearchaeota archaeon]|nr:hypothetical protein [Candidatus Pacearchaeota archaeon]